MFDGKALGEQIVAAVLGALGRALAPISERLAVLEASKGVDELERSIGALRERAARLEEREPVVNEIDLDDKVAISVKGSFADTLTPLLERLLVLEARKGVDEVEKSLYDLQERTTSLEEREATDEPAIEEKIVGSVSVALAKELSPVRERLAVLESRKGVDEIEGAIGDLRERAARLEERKPEKGEPGNDGLGFDDMTLCHDGERAVAIKFVRGEQVKEFTLSLPIVIDRGVYKAEQEYERGDAVTWAGSLWIAQKATTAKPEGGDDWRLAVKRGRDGKDKA